MTPTNVTLLNQFTTKHYIMDKTTIITGKSDAAKLVANAEVLAHTLSLSRRRVYQLIDEGGIVESRCAF